MAARTQVTEFYAESASASSTSLAVPSIGTIASIPAGSLVRFAFRYEGGAAVTVSATDSAGGSYVAVQDTAADPSCAVLYAYNHPGGTNVTITVTLSSARTYREAYGEVVSGTVGESNPITGTYGTFTNGSSGPASCTVTGVSGDCDLFMGLSSYSTSTYGGSGGSTRIAAPPPGNVYAAAYKQHFTGAGDKTIAGLGGAGPTRALAVGFVDAAAATGPTITSQPSNQTVTAGATASFGVTATSSGGALSYQWQRSTNSGGSWSNVSTGTGGTSATYTTATTTVSGGNANNGDQYRCNVTDSNGTTASNAASLTVNAAAATGYSMTGPSSGVVGVASSNFTVTLTPAGGTSAAATITPSDGGGGGTFTPTTVSISTATPSATFTYTAGSAGVKTISVTDSLALTDPASISFTASATSTKGAPIFAHFVTRVL